MEREKKSQFKNSSETKLTFSLLAYVLDADMELRFDFKANKIYACEINDKLHRPRSEACKQACLLC